MKTSHLFDFLWKDMMVGEKIITFWLARASSTGYWSADIFCKVSQTEYMCLFIALYHIN